MKIKVIKNRELINSKPNTEEGDLLELLVTLLEVYEQKNFS